MFMSDLLLEFGHPLVARDRRKARYIRHDREVSVRREERGRLKRLERLEVSIGKADLKELAEETLQQFPSSLYMSPSDIF